MIASDSARELPVTIRCLFYKQPLLSFFDRYLTLFNFPKKNLMIFFALLEFFGIFATNKVTNI